MDNAVSWIEIINAAGVVGLLVLNLGMFLTGKVLPRSVVDTILAEAEQRTTKLADEIKDGIRDAVKSGIVEGIHEVRDGGK